MGNGSANPRLAAVGGHATVRGAPARLGAAFDEQPGWLEALHLAGLWAVAVAQPLFDLLERSPEFFVAHDTRPQDLLGLVLLLCAAGPACLLAALRLSRRAGPVWHALASGAAVGALSAACALTAVKQATDWGADLSFAVAAICGALLAVGYLCLATVRLFATFLSPAAVVAPALFLAQPAVVPLLWSTGAGPGLPETVAPDRSPPVVVVVFDQLPLVSLLDGDGRLDRALYPHFAALADEATWFRNASAVSGWTASALPAILTGDYPRPGRLPTADAHPANLFTLLGSHYDLHVAEPLTDLCPETLCPAERAPAAAWYAAVLRDIAVVYLHTVLPDDLAAGLPPVTQSWRDFTSEDSLADRWKVRRTRDRRRAVTDFIAAIDAPGADRRPALHFLHSLLPHEPWVHLPTGQRHSLRPHILGAVRDRWRDDVLAVTRDYQRHLLQVQFVDTLLGNLLQRLRGVGLYDDALIVVTADHGASLRPGLPFRSPTVETFADIAAVPLIVKRPGQRRGNVSAANVETIDILPTVAAEVGLRLPGDTDGSNVFSEDRPVRSGKSMFVPGQRDRLRGSGDLADGVAQGVAFKLERFEAGDPMRPRLSVHDHIVGVPVAEIQSGRTTAFDVVVDASILLQDVDPDAEFLPAHITGGVVGRDGRTVVPPLAFALNGVVAAVSRTYSFRAFGHATPWEVIVDPRRLAAGSNDVRVFAVRAGRDGAVLLDEAVDIGAPGRWTNLVPELAEMVRGVSSSGFLPTQSTVHGDLRWTTGAARLSVPVDPELPPSVLTVRILTTGPQKRLRIAVDGCTLFEGPVFGRRARTLPLGSCAPDSSPAVIELESNVHLSQQEPGLRLGVAVGAVALGDGEPR